MTEIASPASPNGLAASASLPAIEPADVARYLADYLELTVNAPRETLEAPRSFMSKAKYADTIQRCTRFISESSPLYVGIESIATDEEPREEESSMFPVLIFIIAYAHWW